MRAEAEGVDEKARTILRMLCALVRTIAKSRTKPKTTTSVCAHAASIFRENSALYCVHQERTLQYDSCREAGVSNSLRCLPMCGYRKKGGEKQQRS